MVLQRLTWRDVEAIDRSCIVLIPTGSFEQHGPALPLFTDSHIVSAIAEEVERRMPEKVLLTPTVWLGCSEHHLDFPGTLHCDFHAYMGALSSIVESLSKHGFAKFYLLNGHGGNMDPNSMAFRDLKRLHPNHTFGHMGFFEFTEKVIADLMEGPQKSMVHACEAETSLMMHLQPDLVRTDKLRSDGLHAEPPVKFALHHLSEVSEEGVIGHARYATAAKGKAIFEAAVEGVVDELTAVHGGYVFRGD
jgi:creatinine amidohydrolase